MQEQLHSSCVTQESRLEQITIKGLIGAYLKSEYFLNHYRKESQRQYAQDLRRLLRSPDAIIQQDADELPKFAQEYAQSCKSSGEKRTASALRGLTAWGISIGLLEGNIDQKFYGKTIGERFPMVDYDIHPLTIQDLTRLIQAASNKPRDKALILTILITRASIETIREIRKDNVTQSEDKTATFTAKGTKIEIPEIFAQDILNYAQSIPDGPLFPNHYKIKEPLSRQRIYDILKQYKKDLSLPNLTHKTLVRTGVYLFGRPTFPKSRRRNFSQIPKVP